MEDIATANPDLTHHSTHPATLDFSLAKARLKGHRALIREDQPETFGRMFIALAATGCRASLARRRIQLFQMAATIQPTLIIFSMQAEPDAASLVRDLRQNPATRDCVIIALGGGQSKRERQRLIEIGCQGCLEMPVDRHLFAMDLLQRTPCLLAGAPTPTRAAKGG